MPIDCAFSGCSIYHIENNSNLNLVLGSSELGCIAEKAKVIVDKNNTATTLDNYIIENDYLFCKKEEDYELIAYLGNNETITLPSLINNQHYSISLIKGIKNIIIPDDVTKINISAFRWNQGLKCVSLTKNITMIDSYAFEYCTRLSQVFFNGTMSEWKAITKGNYWNNGTGNYTVYCTDGKLDKNDKLIID